MILNPDVIQNKRGVGEVVARYLIYDCKLPLLAIDDNIYYFIDNKDFKNAIKGMPKFLKIFYGFGLLEYW